MGACWEAPISTVTARPSFSSLWPGRLGTAAGLLLIPALGVLLVGCMGIVAISDEHMRSAFPSQALVVGGTTALLAVSACFFVVTGGRARARAAPLVDDIAALTGGNRPPLTFLAAPRVWCVLGAHAFEVELNRFGRNAPVIHAEEEDAFREMYMQMASAPNAQVPRGRHWRVTVRGNAAAAYQLFVAAKGPLARAGAKLSALEQVHSGDARFDDWAVVYTDQPAAARALLSDAERRTTLLRMLTRNGTYVSNLRVGPARRPTDPCVVQGFVLHPAQTADDIVAGLRDLVTVVGWTHGVG